MIINDIALLSTKMEVWKQYLTLTQNKKLNELNALLLKEVTPESLNELNNFIQNQEDQKTPLNS